MPIRQQTWAEYRAQEALQRLGFVEAAVGVYGSQILAAKAIGISRSYINRLIILQGGTNPPNAQKLIKKQLIKYAGAEQ